VSIPAGGVERLARRQSEDESGRRPLSPRLIGIIASRTTPT
jgi:hypothetical protein